MPAQEGHQILHLAAAHLPTHTSLPCPLQVAAHDAPIRHCFFVGPMNMLITAGWDKTLRFWDCRSPSPVHTQPLPERVYAMDVNYPMVGGFIPRTWASLWYLYNMVDGCLTV